jgi:hypothetical protein
LAWFHLSAGSDFPKASSFLAAALLIRYVRLEENAKSHKKNGSLPEDKNLIL